MHARMLSFSHVQLFATPGTLACQATQGYSQQYPALQADSAEPALQADSAEPLGKPHKSTRLQLKTSSAPEFGDIYFFTGSPSSFLGHPHMTTSRCGNHPKLHP